MNETAIITITIVIITGAISVIAFQNRSLLNRFIFNAYQIIHRREWYRFFSHGLIHADFSHLLVNMFVLYGFGRIVELSYQNHFGFTKGSFYFIALYIGGLLFSSLPAIKRHANNPSYNALGASGAVSAVLFASIMLFPMSSISLLFLPIPMPAFIFGALYLLFEWIMDRRRKDHVAHDAHFWGALFGVCFTGLIDYRILFDTVKQMVQFFT